MGKLNNLDKFVVKYELVKELKISSFASWECIMRQIKMIFLEGLFCENHNYCEFANIFLFEFIEKT